MIWKRYWQPSWEFQHVSKVLKDGNIIQVQTWQHWQVLTYLKRTYSFSQFQTLWRMVNCLQKSKCSISIQMQSVFVFGKLIFHVSGSNCFEICLTFHNAIGIHWTFLTCNSPCKTVCIIFVSFTIMLKPNYHLFLCLPTISFVLQYCKLLLLKKDCASYSYASLYCVTHIFSRTDRLYYSVV